ncbi:cupin domain-containing protein [Microbacterium sp. zg-Y818]|uniref:cupin domain-containing protein n=1 Tax=unclassified Microbacterium TaxID=2609290 RepID=UPI00214B0BB1|nr:MULTISPECIES: cupin domain-containing protein [unclassified Microbacterium]MCR2799559.1 cupin domain-containing protein [Microbacterium sp. zg.Y818]WIM21553.1 cupin domain-containing protein [Microbacterium sp. zg-Y818]
MTAQLGERIRAARTARGLSLRATAAEAAISPSLLSQVETGKVQPSVSTLYAIVSCLGLSLDEVLGNRPPAEVAPAPRVRSRPVQELSDAPEIAMQNGVTWRSLAAGGDEGLDAVLATYEPGAASSLDETHMRHIGVEHGYIVRGELTLKLDFDTFVLRAGDSLCFDAQRPHYYFNHGDTVAEGVWYILGSRRTPAVDAPVDIRNAVDVLDAMGRLNSRSYG